MKQAYVAQEKVLEMPVGITFPFNFAFLTSLEVFYLVPKEVVSPYLSEEDLLPVVFENKALVNYNFQMYASAFSAGMNAPTDEWLESGINITHELELNIIVKPRNSRACPTFEQFILGDEQSRTIGNYRIFVPCDNEIAIAAGKACYGEPKFKTSFRMNLASPNPVRDYLDHFRSEWVTSWGFKINDPSNPHEFIMTCTINLDGVTHVPSNPSPITAYGIYNKQRVASRWNILQPMSAYFLDKYQDGNISLIIGNSSHPMKKAMVDLINNTPASAVRISNSPPVAVLGRPYL